MNVDAVPVVSEKAFATAERGTYVFAVAPEANKTEIKRAVEQGFGVKVAEVRTVRVKGKEIRSRMRKQNVIGRRAVTKKAYVRLESGQSISVFED
jgi:large subunit ribosomal protein L23